jgi:hypothetical protein
MRRSAIDFFQIFAVHNCTRQILDWHPAEALVLDFVPLGKVGSKSGKPSPNSRAWNLGKLLGVRL